RPLIINPLALPKITQVMLLTAKIINRPIRATPTTKTQTISLLGLLMSLRPLLLTVKTTHLTTRTMLLTTRTTLLTTLTTLPKTRTTLLKTRTTLLKTRTISLLVPTRTRPPLLQTAMTMRH
ncbi:hypothetical protein PSTG_19954, partial [Puccinia striiformis f. sp. tritici PST-78]